MVVARMGMEGSGGGEGQEILNRWNQKVLVIE